MLIAFPIFIFIYAFVTPEKRLKEEEVHNSIGAIFEGASTKDKRGVWYNSVFALRRLLISFSLVVLSDYSFA